MPTKLFEKADLTLAIDAAGDYLITAPEKQVRLVGQKALSFREEWLRLKGRTKNQDEADGVIYGLLAEQVAKGGSDAKV